MPVVVFFGPVGERALVEVDGHGLGFAGLEEHLGEALELVLRAGHVGLARSHVHLHGFGGIHIGGVGHGGGHGGGVRAGLGGGDVIDLECGVAQAVAERVVHNLAVGVVVAIADEHALAVVDVAFLARPVQRARVIADVQRNRLGELAGRADLAEDHIGERRAAGLAEQTGFENALGVLGPRGHGDDGAVGQHDHDVLVRGGDLFEQGDLLGGHVEGFAIEALGFRGFRQAQEHEDNVGVLGGFHGLGFEGRVGWFQIEREAGGEVGLDAALGERVEEAGHLGGGDVGGAAALVARGAGEFADNGDLLGRGGRIGDWVGVQRQNRIVVLEHHNGFNSGLMGDFIVGVHIETVIIDAHCSAGLVYQVNHALSHTIELGGDD